MALPPQSGESGRAARSSPAAMASRYFRTDSERPKSSASAVSAWPMETSSMSPMAMNAARLSRFRSCPALTPRPSFVAQRVASR